MRADASSSHAPGWFAGFHDVIPVHNGVRSRVFLATEDGTNRPVALKVLTVDGVTPRGMDAFARESAVLAALSTHPNIVTLYRSYLLDDGRPVLVLERCGGSLADWLRDGKQPGPAQSVSVAIKIAGALETAHRGGVLHLDVRPANILITEFGEPALADFGVARLRSSVPAPAELFEFPSVHVAPELVLGNESSAGTDVYGLASTLYEMVAGQPPLAAYEGESPAATILRILRDPARPIIREDVPIELSDLLLWALAKDPADRPPSVMWFAEELGRIEAHNDWPRTRVLVREPERQIGAKSRRRGLMGGRRQLRHRRPPRS
jgi:serine/threonine protein kinase